MQDYIEERAIDIANYICENNATVRSAAKHFNISKSTAHKDVSDRLKKLNHSLFEATKIILDNNKAQRHIRGGEATRKKYKS